MSSLNLFGGMAIGKMAMEDAGVDFGDYYSCEIDKYANKAVSAMFPGAIQLGDVTQWRDWDIDWPNVNLVTGGFPCQSWSLAGKQLGDKDERGMLFWTMLDIIKHVKHHNPSAHFIIENVKMKKEFEEYITTHTENALGNVHKILINSALVSAQNRNRYYWTSFPVTQPEDEGILLRGILETDYVDREKSHCIDANCHKGGNLKSYFEKHRRQLVFQDRPCELREKTPEQSALCHHVATATDINANESNKRVYAETGKAPTLTTMGGGHREPKVLIKSVNDNHRVKEITENERGYRPHQGDIAKSGVSELGRILKEGADKTDTVTTNHSPKVAVNSDVSNLKYRKLTPRECFRLQTVPEHYIDVLLNAGISNTQLYKICGNSWTMKVISHILKCMPVNQ